MKPILEEEPPSKKGRINVGLVIATAVVAVVFFILIAKIPRVDTEQLQRDRIEAIISEVKAADGTRYDSPPQTTRDGRTTLNKGYLQDEPDGEVIPTREYILRLAKEAGLDVERVDRIVQCESRFESKAKNPNSTAFSYFQLFDGTFEAVNIHTGLKLKRGVDSDEITAGIELMKWQGYDRGCAIDRFRP